jgi:hypothetical protein
MTVAAPAPSSQMHNEDGASGHPQESSGPAPPNAHRTRRANQPRFALWRVEVAALAAALVVAVVMLSSPPPHARIRSTPPGITRLRSGLLLADAFGAAESARSLADRYVFDGSARSGIGYAAGMSDGLVVGVRNHPGWAGWFGVTLHAAGAGATWHTLMSPPPGRVTTGTGEAVFAVQTATTQSTGAINYIVVAAISRDGRSSWIVGYAHGVIADANTQVLWQSPASSTAATALAVTVQTDGRHRLAVWLGDRSVYFSDDLVLDIPPPFQAYLEVQGNSVAYTSRFQDFWVADSSPVTVTGLHQGASVTLMRNGHVLSNGLAAANGKATLTLPPPEDAGTATLVVDEQGGERRYPAMPYAGGDILRIRT